MIEVTGISSFSVVMTITTTLVIVIVCLVYHNFSLVIVDLSGLLKGF